MTVMGARNIEMIDDKRTASQIYRFRNLTVEDYKDITSAGNVFCENVSQPLRYEPPVNSSEFNNSKINNKRKNDSNFQIDSLKKIKKHANKKFNEKDGFLQFSLSNISDSQKNLCIQSVCDKFVYDEHGFIISPIVRSQNIPTTMLEEKNKEKFNNKDKTIITPVVLSQVFFV